MSSLEVCWPGVFNGWNAAGNGTRCLIFRQPSARWRKRSVWPERLRMLAADCGPEAASFFRVTSKAAGEGEILPEVWRRQAEPLPLNKSDKAAIAGLGSDMQGDEEKVCKAVSHVSRVLERSALEAERKRPEEEKRSTALWFSAAALLVILLI